MRWPILDQAMWHELRKRRTGASDASILFDCGYISRFQYFNEQMGLLDHEDFSSNERAMIGRHVEGGIAGAAGEFFGYKLVKSTAYYTDEACDEMLGATPDYFLNEEDSDTVVEIKNASWGAFKDNWIIHEDGFVEAPLRFQIQVQAQLACTGAKQGLLIALISGDRLVRCEMPRHEDAIESIRQRVREFWSSIQNNEPPPAEMPQDYDAARKVWVGGGGAADMRGDPRIEAWLSDIAQLRQTEKAIETDIKRIQGEVLAYCTTNKLASISANGGRISCKWREERAAHTRQFKAQPAHQELRITTG